MIFKLLHLFIKKIQYTGDHFSIRYEISLLNYTEIMEKMVNIMFMFRYESRQANLCLRAFCQRQILTAHAQPFRGARDLAFCLKVPLD